MDLYGRKGENMPTKKENDEDPTYDRESGSFTAELFFSSAVRIPLTSPNAHSL